MSIMDFGHNSFVRVKGLKERIREAEKEIKMRKIEFRGTSFGSKREFYGSHVRIDDKHYIVNPDAGMANCECGERGFAGFVEVDPETVGQFTGLKDKNGEDLDWWEGDLFETLNYTYRIIFSLGCFWFLNITTNQRMLCHKVLKWEELPSKIGNIHQNPKLLEQENGE